MHPELGRGTGRPTRSSSTCSRSLASCTQVLRVSVSTSVPLNTAAPSPASRQRVCGHWGGRAPCSPAQPWLAAGPHWSGGSSSTCSQLTVCCHLLFKWFSHNRKSDTDTASEKPFPSVFHAVPGTVFTSKCFISMRLGSTLKRELLAQRNDEAACTYRSAGPSGTHCHPLR